jgi:hypothetical protein
MSLSASSGFGGGSTTRCFVDFIVSFDQRANRSPALTTMVPSMGVASTNVPLGERTCRPPRTSWKRSVIEPGILSACGRIVKVHVIP